MGKHPFYPSSSSREQLSCCFFKSVCFGVGWSTADEAKNEQSVIWTAPEQIAWKEPQWLALILKPSLTQINPLQPEGQRKLLISTHLFIFRQKIKQLGTAMLCPWQGSCKHVRACKASLHRLNWKWTWDCDIFQQSVLPQWRKAVFRKGTDWFLGYEVTKNHHFDENERFLLNLCFYKTLNNPTDVKHCHFVRTAGTLKQIFAKRMFWCYQGKITQDFNFIGNFNLSCSFSGKVRKKK